MCFYRRSFSIKEEQEVELEEGLIDHDISVYDNILEQFLDCWSVNEVDIMNTT